jgi:hypothetical protein
MIHGNQRYPRASLASTMCASRVFLFVMNDWPRSMLVYVAREWAKVSVKEISRRLHRDPSIISRLYAAYAATRHHEKETRLAHIVLARLARGYLWLP